MKGSKKLVSIYEPVLNDLAQLAKENGLTISELASIILAYSVRLLRGKTNIEETLRQGILLSDAKKLGAVIVPASAIAVILDSKGEGPENLNELVEETTRFLKRLIAYIKAYGSEEITLKDLITVFIPVTAIEQINTMDRTKVVISLNPFFSSNENIALYAAKIASSIIDLMGYEVINSSVHESIIIIEFRQKEEKGG